MTETNTVPTITTVEDAHSLLKQLADSHDWVSVFWDRGWGDSGQKAEISIIVDGNGNDPKAMITTDVYRALLNQKIIGTDCYAGFKARRDHDFKTPPEPERTGPDPAEVAEKVIRSVLADLGDLSVKARFFRGINKGNAWNPINEEVVYTPGYDLGWYVNVSPGGANVHITAWVNDTAGFGDTIDGETVSYPKTGDGLVDEDALRELLVAAIRRQAAVVVQARG